MYLPLSMQELKATLQYFSLLHFIFFCVSVCVCLPKPSSIDVEGRRQFVGVSSLPLLHGSQGLNSGHHQCLCPLNHHTSQSIFLRSSNFWGLKRCASVKRAFVAIVEDPGSISNTFMVLLQMLQMKLPSVASVLGGLMPSTDLHGHQACMWYTNIYVGKTHIK